MKIIRFALISILSLFSIITAISLFIPAHVRISRAINISTKPDTLLNEISDLNKWKYWYPGFDTLNVKPLITKDGKLLSASTGATTITITTQTKDEVNAEFSSGNKKPIISGWKVITYNQTDSLTLQWYLDSKLRWYPWEKFLSLAYEKMYGTQMEQGLNNLKKNVER